MPPAKRERTGPSPGKGKGKGRGKGKKKDSGGRVVDEEMPRAKRRRAVESEDEESDAGIDRSDASSDAGGPSTAPPPAHATESAESGAESDGWEDDVEQGTAGRILRVRLHNFVTHSDVEFHPSEKLNIIVGANGTGKSSIVCGLCLGLGGSPTVLGRADSVKEFVKEGTESGFVELDLSRGEGEEVVTVRRTLNVADNSSSWHVNGKRTAMRDVKALVATLNIQVENLTQFLPQDKVCKLAGMSSQQLLIETERAIGKPGMAEKHMRLIELRKNEKRLAGALADAEDQLAREREANEQLKRHVDRWKQREKLMGDVKVMEKLLPRVRRNALRAKVAELTAAHQAAQAEVAAATEALAPLQETVRIVSDELEAFRATLTGFRRRAREYDDGKARYAAQLDDAVDGCDAIDQDMARLKESMTNRHERIRSMKEDLRATSQQLDALPDGDAVQAELARVQEEEQEIVAKLTKCADDKEEWRGRRRDAERRAGHAAATLERLNNDAQRKVRVVKSLDHFDSHEPTVQSFLWLSRNRDKFEKHVYGPMCVEVTVQNQHAAVCLEKHVARRVWGAYVVQCDADRDLLNRVSMEKQWSTLVLFAPQQRGFTHPAPIETLTRYGAQAFLDDLFEAPAPVMSMLRRMAAVHVAVVGRDDKLLANSLQPLMAAGCMSMYSSRASYRPRRSEYSGGLSTTVKNLPAQAYFIGKVDGGDAAGLMREAQENLTRCNQECAEVDRKVRAIERDMEPLMARRGELRDARRAARDSVQRRAHLNRQRMKLEAKLAALRDTDADAEMVTLRARKAKLLGDQITAARMLAVVCGKAVDVSIEMDDADLGGIGLEQRRAEALQALNEARALVDEKTAAEQDVHTTLRARKLDLQEVENAVPRLSAAEKERAATFDAALQESVERLEEAIVQSRVQATAILADSHAIKTYEARLHKISRLEAAVATTSGELGGVQRELTALKKKWEGPLCRLLARTSTSFSKLFEQIGCRGEVSLARHDDYENYGIEIRVQFREGEELAVLSDTHQSGGERSVATMLYLLALQDVTPSPFRLVDEINQGVDPVLERKIWSLMVDSASRPHVPQYFMLTPKLLPEAPFSEQVTVLTVFNGPYSMDQKMWDLNALFRRTRQHTEQ